MQFKLSTLALAAMSVTSVYAAKVAQLETTLDSLTDQAHTISRYAQAVNAENVQQIIPVREPDS
jgi:predicted ferric reductase